MTEAERQMALEAVATEVRACTRCRLAQGRANAVPGEGHPSTEVLFVGEGPGLNEDRQGRPFVGAAGQFLDELLGSVGWSRDEVFITNVVKCRPPQNRDPEPDEIEACAPFLRRQMEALDPALVVTLGRHSMGRFMPGARIGQVHGTFRPVPPAMGADDALTFAMYHPAAALHQQSLRQTLIDDMAQVPAALLEARRRRTETTGPSGQAAAVAPQAEQGPKAEAVFVAEVAKEPTHEFARRPEPEAMAAPTGTPVGRTEDTASSAEAVDAVPGATTTPPTAGAPAADEAQPSDLAVAPADDPWMPGAHDAVVIPSDTAAPDDQMTLFHA